MKQLTGLDASFLYMETPTTYGHVTGLMVFERPAPDYEPYGSVFRLYASLVGELEPLRRRLVEVPFGLDHPYWVMDPHLDLEYHIRELNVATPGRVDQLAEQVSRIHGRPMDRSRPLWELYVIDGLESGRWALLTKYHHATIDGASGQMMLEIMTDEDPDAPPPGKNLAWEPEAIPSDVELVSRALGNLALNPVKAVRAQARLVRDISETTGFGPLGRAAGEAATAVLRATGSNARKRSTTSMLTTPAPATPWNKAITPHRRFAMRTASLSNIKRLKDTTGGTVNDVVMAICAGALREYLIRHDALPAEPLRAMVPVSIRTGDERDAWTNRVSSLMAELPTDSDDPIERVRRCHEAMNEAKRQFELVPAEALVDLAQFSSPVLATAASRLASRQKLADRMRPPFNLVISNVPGPRKPLYFAGAQLQHQFPVSIVTDGQGLNVTVVSYLDRIDFGFIVDRELVPDVWDLADLHIAEIARLVEATGAGWAVPPEEPFPRRGKVDLLDTASPNHAQPAAEATSTDTTERKSSGTRPAKRAGAAKRKPATAKRKSKAATAKRTTKSATATRKKKST